MISFFSQKKLNFSLFFVLFNISIQLQAQSRTNAIIPIKMISQACLTWINGSFLVFDPPDFRIFNQDSIFDLINNSPIICQSLTINSSPNSVFTDLSSIPIHIVSNVPYYWEYSSSDLCSNPSYCSIPFNQHKILHFLSSQTQEKLIAFLYQYEKGPFFILYQ